MNSLMTVNMTIVDYNTMGHTNHQLKLRLIAEPSVKNLHKHIGEDYNDPHLSS